MWHEIEEHTPLQKFSEIRIRTTAHIATRLRHTRQAFGVNQREFARRVNLKPNRYSQYESGVRMLTVDAANRICDE